MLSLLLHLEAVKHEKVVPWTPLLREHFEATRTAILNAPFLKYPDYSRPFHIATDASNTGIGGVLYQPDTVDDNVTGDNIVAIVSKKLSHSQLNYSAYKKELFAIVYCLRKFHSYVWGRSDLVIVTDHRPLVYMLSSPNLSPALQQWLDVILDYNFMIRHRDGILHVLPDALSRMYLDYYAKPGATLEVGCSSFSTIICSCTWF